MWLHLREHQSTSYTSWNSSTFRWAVLAATLCSRQDDEAPSRWAAGVSGISQTLDTWEITSVISPGAVRARFGAVDSIAVGVVVSASLLTPVGSAIATSRWLDDEDDEEDDELADDTGVSHGFMGSAAGFDRGQKSVHDWFF